MKLASWSENIISCRRVAHRQAHAGPGHRGAEHVAAVEVDRVEVAVRGGHGDGEVVRTLAAAAEPLPESNGSAGNTVPNPNPDTMT
jgi:hypothetical protein